MGSKSRLKQIRKNKPPMTKRVDDLSATLKATKDLKKKVFQTPSKRKKR